MIQKSSTDIISNKIYSARDNWVASLNCQIDFYAKSNRKKRLDCEFDWTWLERHRGALGASIKLKLSGFVDKFRQRRSGNVSQEWFNTNAAMLWDARDLLEDDLSQLLFDNMLILRCTSYSKYYFPRLDYHDFVTVANEEAFVSEELPLDYIGLPLHLFTLKLHQQSSSSLRVISTKAQINLLNGYRQYFVKRNMINLAPTSGDVVLDCGACIGEVSLLIAGLVGAEGEVHLFDPVPLHVRYCELQALLNPTLSHVLHINALAVGDRSRESLGLKNNTNAITPGGLAIDSYSVTTIDDYVFNNNMSRINVIKMDIEGSEMAALEGASRVIREFKPRLAISAYHKPEDLWEIPFKLKAKNSSYKLFFGHHSPIEWESVYYAA